MPDQDTPDKYDLIMHEAARRCERLRRLAVLEEALPSRKAKDSEMARLWLIINEAHALLTEYDLMLSPPAVTESVYHAFEAGAARLHAIVAAASKS